MRNRIIDRFIDTRDNMEHFIPNQRHQTWARILFGAAGLFYLWIHGNFSTSYETIFLSSAAMYFTYNALTLHVIKDSPLSAFRMLFGPLLDVWVVSLGMLIDGGQTSGIYLVFFIIIFGNAVRFGNAMLLYCQALSIIGIISVSLVTLFGLDLELDGTLLLMQSIALIIIPSYVLQIKNQAKDAIQEKQKSESATFGLLDHGPLPAFTFQLDDHETPRILYTNLAMQRIYRDSTINLVGKQVDILALMEDGDEIIKACQSVFSKKENHEPRHFYIRGRNEDDHILQLMGQSMCLRWHGRWIGVCFFLDITQTETARNKLEQSIHSGYMSTMIAGIVHDFRNILTGVIGTAEVISFHTKDQTTQDQLKLIMDAGERGSTMISHLLSLSKTKHDSSTEPATTQSIHRSLSSIVGLLRIQLPSHIQLHLDMQDKFPPMTTGIVEIEQIVSNLINNSVQAIPKTGHIWVTLSAPHANKLPNTKKMSICIHVHDDGNGIPEKDIADITKPFWTSREQEGGTGLGLAMVQRIVHENSGHMDIQSNVGKGTDIYVYLPTKAADVNQSQTVSASSPPLQEHIDTTVEALSPEPSTILLIDDNPEVLSVHTAQLERMGHTILTATDGASGLQQFEKHSDIIKLIISDYKMPKMDGVDFAIAIREKKSDVPILIITAYGEVERLKQTTELSVYILNKPATYKKLANTIAMMQGIN